MNTLPCRIQLQLHFEKKLIIIAEIIEYFFFKFRYANRISTGDEVLVQENDQIVPTKVINVTMFEMQGEYFFNYFHFQ